MPVFARHLVPVAAVLLAAAPALAWPVDDPETFMKDCTAFLNDDTAHKTVFHHAPENATPEDTARVCQRMLFSFRAHNEAPGEHQRKSTEAWAKAHGMAADHGAMSHLPGILHVPKVIADECDSCHAAAGASPEQATAAVEALNEEAEETGASHSE